MMKDRGIMHTARHIDSHYLSLSLSRLSVIEIRTLALWAASTARLVFHMTKISLIFLKAHEAVVCAYVHYCVLLSTTVPQPPQSRLSLCVPKAGGGYRLAARVCPKAERLNAEVHSLSFLGTPRIMTR